jgi:hypothetical protein
MPPGQKSYSEVYGLLHIISTMSPLAENIYMTGLLYHNYRRDHIVDNGLKSRFFINDDDLGTSRST